MPSADLLASLARGFASKIQDLLNATVCDGSGISAVVSADPNLVLVGHGLTKQSLVTEPFPVKIGRRKATCWLDVSFRMCLDDASRYLTVVSSFFGIYADDPERSCLCHFDYERDKPGYPEAHLQVPGESTALAGMTGQAKTRSLDRLHFPVGGRRFRPILEDVFEFLIVERFARPRDDRWVDVLKREREEYYTIQLRAAIRRNPEVAKQALSGIGLTSQVVPQQRVKRIQDMALSTVALTGALLADARLLCPGALATRQLARVLLSACLASGQGSGSRATGASAAVDSGSAQRIAHLLPTFQ